jgi:hypothetical protein
MGYPEGTLVYPMQVSQTSPQVAVLTLKVDVFEATTGSAEGAERQNAGINAKTRIKTKRAKRRTETTVEVEMVTIDRSAQEIQA